MNEKVVVEQEKIAVQEVGPLAEWQSATVGQLAAALAVVQGAMKNPARTQKVTVRMKTGGTYFYDYAPMEAHWDVLRALLAKNGLAVVQTMRPGEMRLVSDTWAGWFTIETTLAHASGEWIRSAVQVPGDPDPKNIGSVITYYRRYLLSAITGTCPEDTDTQEVQPRGDEPAPAPRRDVAPPPRKDTPKDVPAEPVVKPTPAPRPVPKPAPKPAGKSQPGDLEPPKGTTGKDPVKNWRDNAEDKNSRANYYGGNTCVVCGKAPEYCHEKSGNCYNCQLGK